MAATQALLLFSQVEGLPVYGVAIPTVRGVRNAINAMGAMNGARMWG